MENQYFRMQSWLSSDVPKLYIVLLVVSHIISITWTKLYLSLTSLNTPQRYYVNRKVC